jgi:hypothetical protein
MSVIREECTARPGQASKLAAMFKSVCGGLPTYKTRVLRDAISTFNTVVIESQVPEMAAFDKMMAEYASRMGVRRSSLFVSCRPGLKPRSEAALALGGHQA